MGTEFTVENHYTICCVGRFANQYMGTYKHTGSSHGQLLKYVGHTDTRNTYVRKLEIEQQAEHIRVISHVQFYDNISVIRTWNEVINAGTDEETLEYVSSFALTGCLKEGLKPWNEKGVLHLPHNTWAGEVQWRKYSLPELGLNRVEGTSAVADPLSRQNFSMKRISIVSNGTWGCSEYLPMGSLENTESGLCMTWQREFSFIKKYVQKSGRAFRHGRQAFLHLTVNG